MASRRALAVLACLVAAGCGADGAPERPAPRERAAPADAATEAPATRIGLRGEVAAGVAGRS